MALRVALADESYRIFMSGMRVRVPSGPCFFPDLSVASEERFEEDIHGDILLNPILVVEVFSRITEVYDRTEKLRRYKRIPSLHECVLISESEPHVESFLRQPENKWLQTEVEGLDGSIQLTAVPVLLKLADIYQNIL